MKRRYLLVFPTSPDSDFAEKLERNVEALKEQGYHFTGEIEEVKMTAYIKIAFEKEDGD